jgi:hypothetical protein
MTNTNCCKDCKFFGAIVTVQHWSDEDYTRESTYHECTRIKQDDHREFIKGQGARVIDGSGYYAAIVVEEDFGCVQFEPKHIETDVAERPSDG